MHALSNSPLARLATSGLIAVVLLGGAVVAHGPATQPRTIQPAHFASRAPHGAVGHLWGAKAVSAAQACAGYSAAAGWPNNGPAGGDLVTATAICVAESGGQVSVYHCDKSGDDGDYPPVTCSGGGPYDRGLWQLNNIYQPQVTNTCAFRGQCNADAAYEVSAQGTNFSPWAVYGDGVYTQYLPAAQAAIAALSSGAVTDAVPGRCLTRSTSGTRTAVVAGKCGRGVAAQQWSGDTGALRQGTRCLTAGAHPAVAVTACAPSAAQTWTATPLSQLQNSQDSLCLTEKGTVARPAQGLTLAPCATVATPTQTWWLP
jgi:hypothetical protein